MDWSKLDADIAWNPKVAQLSDGAYRAMTYLWGYAMRHETGGYIPEIALKLVPKVTKGRISEMERFGFLERNGAGWHIHDFEENQKEAIRLQEARERERERGRKRRAEGTGGWR